MPGDEEALRMHLRTDALRNAENDAAHQRAPQRACATDDHGLEREDQLIGTGVRVEGGPHGEEGPGDRHGGHGNGG